MLGSSNRGGRRVRRKTFDSSNGHALRSPTALPQTTPEEHTSFQGLGTLGTYDEPESSRTPQEQSGSSSDVETLQLQNPSDALGILARVAGEDKQHAAGSEKKNSTNNAEWPFASGRDFQPQHHQRRRTTQGELSDMSNAGHSMSLGMTIGYAPLDSGQLTVAQVGQLLHRYQQFYHPYYPIAPVQTFNLAKITDTARSQPHLLTAILVISSKDLVDEPHIYDACATYMKLLASNLAAGGDAGIEAVEALLILAEWTPYTQKNQSSSVGRGEEDREVFMHSGLAVRIAYFLGLDRFSFRIMNDGKDKDFDRKRLIWTACFMADRHVSIRVGKAFWARGPGPLTTLNRNDYPSLLPQNPNEEDYASIFQANLELTSLFSNVHDVLYSNPGSSFRSHLSGGYIKFIDDFRSAIYGWKSVWGTLTCSPHLKATLLMSYDYLRLYTNAFAFQATIKRVATKQGNPNVNMQMPSGVFAKNNVATNGDARFIYEGLDAAKAILTTANNFVDPEKMLRFMPLRFYLYLVYAGVFLYRARAAGVIGSDEDRAIKAMIQQTVDRLQRSSVGQKHLGSRYSQLIRLLWEKVGSRSSKSRHHNNSTYPPISTAAAGNGAAMSPPTPTALSQHGGSTDGAGTGESPAMTERMGDFSWTDLMAVGDFAINGANGEYQNPSDDVWAGFMPVEMNGFSGMGWEFGGEGGDMGMAF